MPVRSPERRMEGSGGGGSGGAPANKPWGPRALPIAPARPGWRIAGGRGVGNHNLHTRRSNLLFTAAFGAGFSGAAGIPHKRAMYMGHVWIARHRENKKGYPEIVWC